jgi:hypothetical protein
MTVRSVLRKLRFPLLFGGFLTVYSLGFRYKDLFWKDELEALRQHNIEESERNQEMLHKFQQEYKKKHEN